MKNMKRVFIYKGRGPTPSEAAEIVRKRSDATLVDQFGDNLVIIVEGDSFSLDGWVSTPTRYIEHP